MIPTDDLHIGLSVNKLVFPDKIILFDEGPVHSEIGNWYLTLLRPYCALLPKKGEPIPAQLPDIIVYQAEESNQKWFNISSYF